MLLPVSLPCEKKAGAGGSHLGAAGWGQGLCEMQTPNRRQPFPPAVPGAGCSESPLSATAQLKMVEVGWTKKGGSSEQKGR